jgi:hypothetical protein
VAALLGLTALIGVQAVDLRPAPAGWEAPEPDPPRVPESQVPLAHEPPPSGPPPPPRLAGFEIGPPVPLPHGEPAVGLWDCRRAAEFGLRQRLDLSALGLASFEGDSGAYGWKCDGVWTGVGPMRYAASVLCHVTNDETGVAELMPARVELALEPGDQLLVADRQVQDWRCRRLPVSERPADAG